MSKPKTQPTEATATETRRRGADSPIRRFADSDPALAPAVTAAHLIDAELTQQQQRHTSATMLRAEAERFRRKAEQLAVAAHFTPPLQIEVKRIHSHLLRAEVFKEAAALVERHF